MLYVSVIITRDTESVEFKLRNIKKIVKISLQQVALTKSELIFRKGEGALKLVYSVEIKG